MSLTDSLLRQLENPKLTANERASIRCRVAADLIHTGQYEQARESLGELWRGAGARPNLEGLDETTAAEVLLQCGSLTGCLGASKPIAGAQDAAKDLISEALRIFEAHGLQARAAEAEYELGVCYWRSGALDEARVVLRDAVSRLSDGDVEQKAKILIRSTIVEISAGRYHDALKILDEAQPVFTVATDALKGRWHGQRAVVLRRLGTAEGRAEYFDRAIIEYTAAIFHFEQARHERYGGNAENNLAFLLYKLGRYEDAHGHLDRAQRIFTKLEDAGNLAQVWETRARVFLAEKKYKAAAEVIGNAVGALESAGELALLSDALTVQAAVEAKLGQHDLSLPTFRRAVKIAEQAGAVESAGLAALSLIEEHGAARISEEELYLAYIRADEWLRQTQDAEAVARLHACARIIARRLGVVRMGADFRLPEEVRRYEARFIRRALADAKGSVTNAARRLGITYQKLQNLLKTHHKDLLPARTPVKPRRRSIIRTKQPQRAVRKQARPATVLHVEDSKIVADTVRDALEMEGLTVVTCVSGAAALKMLEGKEHYDLLLLDNDLPHVNGVELIRRARQLPHRRRTPVIMFSAGDVQAEAWRAGADAVLKKPDDMGRLTAMVKRLLAGGE
jgi:CheY-like chemotaxis protein/tetratricopeptide (TPR) repeat protein